jgi:septum formation protein
MRGDTTPLILASTSSYRRELLARLGMPFEVVAPSFEEAEPGSMAAADLVRHNTLGKGRAVAEKHPGAHVIASDQLAVCEGRTLGKPGDHTAACRQLALLSGRMVEFMTGVALLEGSGARYEMVPFRVYFRTLSTSEIEHYLHMDRPYDCAGSFKSESLGIALFERMQGDDPTALMGLPLITLASWLKPLQYMGPGMS